MYYSKMKVPLKVGNEVENTNWEPYSPSQIQVRDRSWLLGPLLALTYDEHVLNSDIRVVLPHPWPLPY